MTHENRGHYAGKHPPERKVNQEIADAVKQRASEGEISCAAVFRMAGDLGAAPAEIGFTLDVLEIPLVKCQLGLYGYRPEKRIVKPMETVPQPLADAIQETLDNNRLTCARAWEIAERLAIRKIEVASACEALKIKISSCQLGAF
jgi:hypothetical protein